MTGPAGWEVGTYLQGTENKPVTGFSWYEALAYARYKGKYTSSNVSLGKSCFSTR